LEKKHVQLSIRSGLVGLLKKLVEKLDRLSSKSAIKYGVYLTAVALFFTLILIPPLLGILIKWGTLLDFSATLSF
jgi:hypothetical protein